MVKQISRGDLSGEMKFIKIMKNQGVGKNYPLHYQHGRGVWGKGDMPQGTVQSVKFHPLG